MNTSVTRAQMQEAKEQHKMVVITHSEPNRKERRLKEQKGILNQRKQTKGRKNGAVLNKKASFAMWRMNNLLRTGRA